jgi:hypothetical protein
LPAGWHPLSPTNTLPTGADPNNVLVQAVQHGTQTGLLPPPVQPPPSSGLGIRVR